MTACTKIIFLNSQAKGILWVLNEMGKKIIKILHLKKFDYELSGAMKRQNADNHRNSLDPDQARQTNQH